MEKNKKRVFTGTVAMLVILFGLLRIAIFTGYHMVRRSFPKSQEIWTRQSLLSVLPSLSDRQWDF